MLNRKSRIYQKRGRFYANFRNLEGRLEALIPPGESRATTDPDVAARLVSDRLTELREAKESRDQVAKDRVFGIQPQRTTPLAEYSARHLTLKAKDGEGVPAWLSQAQRHLETAVTFFGAGVELGTLTPRT